MEILLFILLVLGAIAGALLVVSKTLTGSTLGPYYGKTLKMRDADGQIIYVRMPGADDDSEIVDLTLCNSSQQ